MGFAVPVHAEYEKLHDREFGDDLPDVIDRPDGLESATSGSWMSIRFVVFAEMLEHRLEQRPEDEVVVLNTLRDDADPHCVTPDFRRRVGRGATFSSSRSGCM